MIYNLVAMQSNVGNYREDPLRDFMPDTGTIDKYRTGSGFGISRWW